MQLQHSLDINLLLYSTTLYILEEKENIHILIQCCSKAVDRRQASIFHFFMTMPPWSIYLPAVPAGTLLACLYFLLIVIFFFVNNDDVLQLGLMVLISSYLILLENLVIWDQAHWSVEAYYTY